MKTGSGLGHVGVKAEFLDIKTNKISKFILGENNEICRELFRPKFENPFQISAENSISNFLRES